MLKEGRCCTLADLQQLESLKDKTDAQKTYRNFLDKCNTGQNLSLMYDPKKCQEAFSFSRDGHELKVWRLWGSGKIRVYFIYAANHKIVVLKTLAKRTDALAKGDKDRIEESANLVFDEIEAHNAEELFK